MKLQTSQKDINISGNKYVYSVGWRTGLVSFVQKDWKTESWNDPGYLGSCIWI